MVNLGHAIVLGVTEDTMVVRGREIGGEEQT
jgi:hypothetical protein